MDALTPAWRFFVSSLRLPSLREEEPPARTMNSGLPRQVSLLHVFCLRAIPTPTTLDFVHRFYTLPFSVIAGRKFLHLGFAISQQARQVDRPNRVHFRLGLVVRLPMLPTPPHGDAVSVGYKPENVYLKRTYTFLTKHTCKRTGTGS
jgi:hypothetical protein